jgi:hypothetical protein
MNSKSSTKNLHKNRASISEKAQFEFHLVLHYLSKVLQLHGLCSVEWCDCHESGIQKDAERIDHNLF